jgi:5-methylcytosine-specific restriction protein B
MIVDDKTSYEIWDQFLESWPLSRVRNMTLEEYTKAGSQECFTHWIENKLDKMGSIWGGSAFKFGIYSREDRAPKESAGNRLYSSEYGWFDKYGSTPQEAFTNVKAEILKTIEAVQSGNLGIIDEVDLGHAFKWKIAFHYQDRKNPQIVPIFKPEALLAITQNENKIPISQIHSQLLNQKQPNVELLSYGRDLWGRYSGMNAIWKISHGKGDFPDDSRQKFLDRKVVTVHGSTGKGQGDAFAEEMNPGDFFYLCHGNDAGIVLLGRITSDATSAPDSDGWLERSYEIIKQLEKPKRYQGISKGWAPNYNSTVKRVKPNELGLFEEHILRKYFELRLSDLDPAYSHSQTATAERVRGADTTSQLVGLNTIYYGPPGTGKTYKLLTEIADKYFVDRAAKKTNAERAIALIDDSNLSWWQSVALSLLDLGQPSSVPTLAEHPIMQAKITSSSSKQPRSAIWAHLQMHTKADCPNVNYSKSAEPLIFWKDENSIWSIDQELVETSAPDLIDLLKFYQDTGEETENIRYVFTTFHQSFSYEDFVEGIKPVIDSSLDSTLSYRIEPGVFKSIATRAKANPEKAYAIFIDEINRGNVASIFGELITLIEPDKRLGAANEVIATLPYSKSLFGVPSNLHIIGTMNTADRSIVSLDSALRRRFQFEECFPEPERIEQPDDLSVDLRELLKVINQRITMLIDRDHSIGHSYFMGIARATNSLQALRDVFSRSVIPLLEEYFAGDLARVGMILGERFVQPIADEEQATPLAPGNWDIGAETKDVYTLTDVTDLSEEDFASIYEFK